MVAAWTLMAVTIIVRQACTNAIKAATQIRYSRPKRKWRKVCRADRRTRNLRLCASSSAPYIALISVNSGRDACEERYVNHAEILIPATRGHWKSLFGL